MKNGTLFFNGVCHPLVTDKLLVSRQDFDRRGFECTKKPWIKPIRCGVELLPEWSRNDYNRGTLNRRGTMARTRILMSVFPSFQLVLSKARTVGPLRLSNPTFKWTTTFPSNRTYLKKRCKRDSWRHEVPYRETGSPRWLRFKVGPFARPNSKTAMVSNRDLLKSKCGVSVFSRGATR